MGRFHQHAGLGRGGGFRVEDADLEVAEVDLAQEAFLSAPRLQAVPVESKPQPLEPARQGVVTTHCWLAAQFMPSPQVPSALEPQL